MRSRKKKEPAGTAVELDDHENYFTLVSSGPNGVTLCLIRKSDGQIWQFTLTWEEFIPFMLQHGQTKEGGDVVRIVQRTFRDMMEGDA